jgi:amidase
VAITELTAWTATELAARIGRRELSAREVVLAHLERIEALAGTVNAVVRVDAERALERARECDERPPAGPLHGVPFTVKDNVEAAGIEMAIGAPERAGVVPDADATVVARMRAAGAILLGKTNCPPYGGGIETDNDVYGLTRNPYDLDRSAGGSSGGEAAAVAAGASPCGLGTDSGASVRLPAHFCGVAALKPTAGLVPVTGVIDDEGQIGALGDARTQVGPLARSADDLALLLRVVAGPDGRDGGVAPVPLREPDPAALRGLRVAAFADDDFAAADADTRRTLDDAAAVLADGGAMVAAERHPGGGHELTIEVWESYGGAIGSDELYRLLRRWDAFRGEMLASLERFDLVLCPVFPEAARRHGDVKRAGEPDPTSFTTPFSLAGWPVATVRCGSSSEGLPIGVQLAAAPWRDDLALAAAGALERALGGWRPPPL